LVGLPLAVVVRPLDSPLLNRLAERLRARTGAELIAKRRALPAVVDALRRGRMIGILLDQNASRAEGVFVPFFGRPTSTSRSLALLALRTGRPIVPVFIHREPDGRHRVVLEAALGRPAAGSPDAFVPELEQIKGQSRESLRTYRAAALAIRRREEAYERAVWEAGAAGLVLSHLVGPDGRASFGEVAAGPWLLWGRHEVWNPVVAKRLKRQERQTFALGLRRVGFWTL